MPPKKPEAKKKVVKKSAKTATRTSAARPYAVPVSLSTGQVKPAKAQEIHTSYVDHAYKFSEARKKDTIHPRKVIPKVPRGPKVLDMLPTTAMALEAVAPLEAVLGMRGCEGRRRWRSLIPSPWSRTCS